MNVEVSVPNDFVDVIVSYYGYSALVTCKVRAYSHKDGELFIWGNFGPKIDCEDLKDLFNLPKMPVNPY